MKKRVISVLLLCALAASVLSGCGSGSDGETVSVQSVPMVAQVSGLGTANRYGGMVVAQNTIDVNKESGRTVAEVFVTVGQEVKEGDSLFSYDVEELKLALEKLQLEKEQIEDNIQSSNSQINELEKERSNAPSSEKESFYVQIRDLELSISEYKYNLGSKESEIERTNSLLKNSEVKAPASGVIQKLGDASSDSGEGDGTAFITIMETGDYKVKGVINEMNNGELTEGSQVIIRSRIDESLTWTGHIESIDWNSQISSDNDGMVVSSSADGGVSSTSSSYPFYVVLDDAEGLFLGQHVFIEEDIGQSEEREGIWMPSGFICDIEGDPYIWTAGNNDKLHKTSVELGTYDAEQDLYEIVSGIAITDYIAFPADGLKEGMLTSKYDEGSFGSGDGEDGAVDDGMLPEGDGGVMPQDEPAVTDGADPEADVADGGTDEAIGGEDGAAAPEVTE